ncbi:MAG: thioredoxin fold domain-containing protein [Planctomycetes bacterium]|nr:thioredoxin fold domain-containing protein [Planctomycetota bacterium]
MPSACPVPRCWVRARTLGLLCASVLVQIALAAAEDEKPAFTILFTAEAHGALLPCDCPLQPLGGVARRATLIKRYRERGPVLLVDAGGWAAGGIYDEDTDGDAERDNLRTDLMVKALEGMKYNLVAWGDVDGKWIENNSSRCESFKVLRTEIIKTFTEDKWAQVGINNQGVGIDWFWKSSKFSKAPLNLPVSLSDGIPIPTFHAYLLPFGEDTSEEFAKAHLQSDLIVSAGRKTSTRVSWTAGNTVIANFDYQCRSLGVAEVFPRKGWKAGDAGPRWDIRIKQESLTPEIPDDPEMTALLAPHLDALRKKGKKKVEIEFWTLPRCPYCLKLEPELAKIAADLGARIALVPHFMVEKTADGKFIAMHDGKDETKELDEAGVQAVIAKYHPERFWDWLAWREKNPDALWETGVKDLGLPKASIAGALAANEHLEIFEKDYQLAVRRRIQGTPTLVLANKIYEGENQRLQILRALCGMLDEPKPEVCKSVPACFFDAECRKRGYVGKCLDAGKPGARCDFSQKAVRVPVRVLREPDALYSNHESILEVLLGRLPGIEWSYLDPVSEEGRALVQRCKIDRFPAYLIDPDAKTEANYAENFANAVDLRDGVLVLRSEVQGAHRIAARPRMLGRADLFVSRFSQPGTWAVEIGIDALSWRDAPEVVLHDGLYWNERRGPDGKVERELAARGGLAEIEDAAVAIAIRVLAPEKLNAYLLERGKRRGSEYGWLRAMQAAGVEVDKVLELAEGPDRKGPVPPILKILHAEANLLDGLGAGGDVVLLAENCELIPVRSRQELRYYLEQIGKRRPKPER